MALDAAKKEVLDRAKSDNVKFINLQFTDVMGFIKSVSFPIGRLEDSLDKGTWFDGSSIQGFTRICESDMFLMPDHETYKIIPWKGTEKKTARLMCDVYTPDGKPFEGDPRYILKRAIASAKKMGFVYNTGPELEFYLVLKSDGRITTVPHDVGGYFDFSPRDLASHVRRDIMLALEDMGMEVETSHHEVGPGQHEIDVKYSDALSSADNTLTLKYAIKAIAQKYDLHATFMPKPMFGNAGSGMHVHQSLFDLKGSNMFYDANDQYKLSKVAYSFVAGQLEHARALSGVVAPTVNSYKRLVPGFEAPVYVCWGQVNRSALIRVPRFSKGREQSTRVELRCPDPSCNPYLAFAAMLEAGLDGIKRNLTPPKPVEEDVYEFDDAKLKELNIKTLPGSLSEAMEELKKDQVLVDALGKHAFSNFASAQKAVWDEYRVQVTQWELDRYLETI
jgi:glutamine synthetase